MSEDQHPSVTDQINQRVDRLAELLIAHSDGFRDMKSIGVHLSIPMGVRQRLIQNYGSEAREWIDACLTD
jgi:hypothetical protein